MKRVPLDEPDIKSLAFDYLGIDMSNGLHLRSPLSILSSRPSYYTYRGRIYDKFIFAIQP